MISSLYPEFIYFLILSHQDKLRDRDAQIEETAKVLSEKQDSVSRLEQDLSNCRSELMEREKRINDILHTEVPSISLYLKKEFCEIFSSLYEILTCVLSLIKQANLKQDTEKRRKLLAQFKVCPSLCLEK